jgi:hypothetical protein
LPCSREIRADSNQQKIRETKRERLAKAPRTRGRLRAAV